MKVAFVRITPACAGKTWVSSRAWEIFPDHPRMRGEDELSVYAEGGWLGSPPHARGRLAGLRGHDRKVRITPACAGKTRRGPGGPRGLSDHPRMRGEDIPRSA